MKIVVIFQTGKKLEFQGKMKLVMTLLIRDEADIITENVKFHLDMGVDFFIVTDNSSVDGSVDILQELERQGILRLIHQPADDYSQGEWVTRMVHLAQELYGADWLLNSDADEFWIPNRSGSLKNVLEQVPSEISVLAVDRTNFVARPSSMSEPFWRRMVHRETVSLNTLGQRLPSKACHRAMPGVQVMQGNHGLKIDGVPVSAIPTKDIEILHFPARTYAQFENKIAKGGAAYARNTKLSPGVGRTWRELYKLHQSQMLESYYRTNIEKSDSQIADGLADKSLIVDSRLEDHFCNRGQLG